jgi:AcrR family transcriptional regulator
VPSATSPPRPAPVALPSDAGPGTADADGVTGENGADGEKSTRERILDIALDLFTEQGYDKTSLRQLAEELGFSKAAVYYHFASKGDILLALHYRLHDQFGTSLDDLNQRVDDPEAWAAVLDAFIEQMLSDRRLFILHERNRAAFEQLHREDRHTENHVDIEETFRNLFANPAVPVADRVRLSCAVGAIMGSLAIAGEAFTDVPTDELAGLIRSTVGGILSPR